MVSLSALNRKLLRDLWLMKGQAFAIAMVVAAGVAMYVMYQSNFASLSETRRVYYERQRFADVFASLKRAPQRLAADIAAIPGVSAMETRVVSRVTLDLDQLDEPAGAQLVSIPVNRRPRVNDLYLLLLARQHSVKLATFDHRIPAEAIPEGAHHLEILLA